MTRPLCAYEPCDQSMDEKRPHAVYCSREHKQAASRRRRPRRPYRPRPARVPVPCLDCDVLVVPPLGVGRPSLRCPEHRAAKDRERARKLRSPLRMCVAECGRTISSNNKRGYCPDCRPKAIARGELIRFCPVCRLVFSTKATKVYCSTKCRRAAEHERNSDYYAAKYKRRRAVRTGVEAEVFADAEIYVRDGWVCQICGEPIDRQAKAPAPLSRSLDHIKPISKGGPHTRANIQAAHLRCNNVKNDRVDYGAFADF